MKRLSAALLLTALATGCFAACSSASSDDADSDAGSSGAGTPSGGNASTAGTGGTRASSGGANDGEAGASSNGAGTGGNDIGAGGTQSNAGAAGADESGGAAGDASAGAGGVSDICGPAAHAQFANGLAAYFQANAPDAGCVQSVDFSVLVSQCPGKGCAGNSGCAATFSWSNVTYDATTGAFSANLDITASVTDIIGDALGGGSCVQTEKTTASSVHGTVSVQESGTTLHAQPSVLFVQGTRSVTGCPVVSEAAPRLASNNLDSLFSQAGNAVIATFLNYRVDCAP